MIPNTQIRQLLLLLLIGALFALIFSRLALFTPALLGAYTLYVLLRKPMHFLCDKWRWNPQPAAALLMLLSFVVILLPVNALVQMLGAKLMAGLQNTPQILHSIQSLASTIENALGIVILTPDRLHSISDWGVGNLSGVLNATLLGVIHIILAYIILWFMLSDHQRMERSFFKWLPLRDENIEFVRKELNDLVYSNALGIPLMGVVQGLAGLLGYWLAGVEELWFWVFMTFIAGMMPFLGVALAFLPLSMILFSQGLVGQGAFVLIYGFIVIGSVDNLARMWLLKKIGNTHPLVTLFGVIIGLPLFGFIGFIFGPILISMFLLLIRIYHKEFR